MSKYRKMTRDTIPEAYRSDANSRPPDRWITRGIGDYRVVYTDPKRAPVMVRRARREARDRRPLEDGSRR